jgi:trk system potassium uptake protein TrkH
LTPISPRWIEDWEVTPKARRGASLTPPQLFAGSFLALITLGTLGLLVLPGLYVGERLSFLDALFTAVSAVCVTGLIVVDTATYFTPLGQGFILLLIQLGGLGMITLTTLIIITLGRRLSLRQEVLSSGTLDIVPSVNIRNLTRDVVRFTLLIEAAGAALLFLLWTPYFGPAGAVWPSIFHAVSAFCNAGFSVFSDSMIGFQTSPAVLFVIMALIVIGGLGFLTLEEIYLWRGAQQRRETFRLSLHSRIVLTTTGVLILVGTIAFTMFEWRVTFAHLPMWARPLNGLFMSVTARTAGFNSIDYADATTSSNFLTIILMSIGGSPGSMAGGLKTTTIALIGLLAWSRFRGDLVTSFWGRTIPEEVIQRAVGLFVVAFGLVTAATFVLTVSEIGRVTHAESGGSFLVNMFEAASAFNTVGLSMGVTVDLSTVGKWVMILLMFLGRVGPLTFAAAIALKASKPVGQFRYAYEEVVVG